MIQVQLVLVIIILTLFYFPYFTFFLTEKLGVVIQDLKEELQNQKSRNSELVKSLDEERKVSEELKYNLESVNGVNEQIAELEQLITGDGEMWIN